MNRESRGISHLERQPSCYPDRARRDELRKAGYKLYLGGKLFREEKKK